MDLFLFYYSFMKKIFVQSDYFTMTVEYAHALFFHSDPFITSRRTDDTNLKFFFQDYFLHNSINGSS